MAYGEPPQRKFGALPLGPVYKYDTGAALMQRASIN